MPNNIQIWDDIYARDESYLRCPDDTFIRLFFKYKPSGDKLKVLDYGAGSGPVSEFLLSLSHKTYSVDSSPSACAMLRKRLSKESDISQSLEELSLGDDSLDMIVAWHVLYYLPRDRLKATLSDFKRLLKPGGIIVCTMLGEEDVFITSSSNMNQGTHQMQYGNQSGACVLGVDLHYFYNMWLAKNIKQGQVRFEFDHQVNHYQLLVIEND